MSVINERNPPFHMLKYALNALFSIDSSKNSEMKEYGSQKKYSNLRQNRRNFKID